MRTNIWTSSTPRTSAEVTLRVVDSLATVPAEHWNALASAPDLAGNPFVRHEFLLALERTGCVGAGTGWVPRHLLLQTTSGEIEAALPLYSKSDSWGEFVFDWSWARAYAQAGLTDVTHHFYQGARHEIFNDTNRDEVTRELLFWLREKVPGVRR
jgi:predicted N-acyltransferase